MFDRPRNWKWMVPASLLGPCLVWWGQWAVDGGRWEEWAAVPMVLTIVLGVAALANLLLYVFHYWVEMSTEARAVLNQTPEVRMFEAAKVMHPETAKALLVHRRTIWRQKYVAVKDLVDYILDEAEIVHLGFADFVLAHSSAISIMSKRMLSEGSKQFDPDEQVTDYEQYDAFVLLLQSKLMITQAYGNQAGQWIPPWNPASVGHRFGLDEAFSAEPEELSEAVKTIIRAQSKGKGNGGVKELATLPAASQHPSTARVRSAQDGGRVDVPELTDEEMEAIRLENERYEKQFS